jgi:hypothetical protein
VLLHPVKEISLYLIFRYDPLVNEKLVQGTNGSGKDLRLAEILYFGLELFNPHVKCLQLKFEPTVTSVGLTTTTGTPNFGPNIKSRSKKILELEAKLSTVYASALGPSPLGRISQLVVTLHEQYTNAADARIYSKKRALSRLVRVPIGPRASPSPLSPNSDLRIRIKTRFTRPKVAAPGGTRTLQQPQWLAGWFCEPVGTSRR